MKQRQGRRNSLRQQNFTTMDVSRRRSRPGEQRDALDLFGSVAHRVSGNLLDNLNVARLSAPASAALQASCVAREGALEDLGATCRLFARCVAKTVARTKTQRRFRACVIGTGPAGSRIASMLLESGDVLPRELVVHSRHFPPQGLPEEVHHAKTLEDAIVECVPRIIFLVCTFGQFETLASDLHPILRPTHVICPLVAGLSAAKAGKMLGIAHPVRIISYRHYTPVAHLACALCEDAESKAQDRAGNHGMEPRIDEISETVASAPAPGRRTRLARDEFALALEALRAACILQATSLGLTLEKAEQACEAVISGPGMAQSARALFLVQDPRSRAKLLPMASAYF